MTMKTISVAALVACLLPAVDPCELRAQEQTPTPPADTVFSQPPISPGGAFWRSLVLPGWAQSELGAKSRGAFYFFAEAVSIMMWARTQKRLDQARRTEPEDSPLVEARVEQREDWIALAVFWAFASAADGFVAAHLWGFEERTGAGPVELSADFPGMTAIGVKIRVGL